MEPTDPAHFFDDWSHSLVMVMVWATLFAVVFYRRCGVKVFWAVWLAVFSHFLLDFPIHPKDLALYPHSVHLGWGLWRIGPLNYWLSQLIVLLALLGVYTQGSLRQRLPGDRIAMSCYLVVALHLLLFPHL